MIEIFRRDAQEEQKVIERYSFLDLNKAKKSLQEAIEGLESPLQVMVMGAFSTGKSSFVNALKW